MYNYCKPLSDSLHINYYYYNNIYMNIKCDMNIIRILYVITVNVQGDRFIETRRGGNMVLCVLLYLKLFFNTYSKFT